VTPVAVGESFRHGIIGENMLVTEAIPGACSLEEYVAEHLPKLVRAERAVVRRKLIESLARLCAAVHRAGVFHNDLHAGNVLVQPETCGGRDDAQLPELHLIDLAGARLSSALGWRRSRDSLVMLGASWAGKASRSDLVRFLRAYFNQRPELRLSDARGAARELAERIWKRRRRVARGRDRRSLRNNRDFYRIVRPAAAGHAVADFPRDEFERLLASPDHPLRAGAHRPLKLAHRSVVVQTDLPLAEGSVRVAYKRVRAKNWWKALAFFLGRSPAMDAWYLGHALLLRGVATARPLMVCETRKRGLRGDSYLATQWIDGAINLHLYGWKLARSTAAERRVRTRQAAVALGRLLGRMHAWNISHPDLKGCNLLIAEQAAGLEVFLIDLDGVRLARRLRPSTRARNLGRLATSIEAHPWVTRTDRLRFLRAYLQEASPSQACDWKRLWRAAGAAGRAITRRLKRRGRQVV
jgi:tRNA A-37 threonylcarbamoyl transferase component Bud32